MALPDYYKIEQGTAVVWGDSGGSGVTHVFTLDALGIAGARMGTVADLGATFDEEYIAILRVETGTAPTAGTIATLWLASSHDNSGWPGKVTGSDGVYPATIADNIKQLGPPAVILVATADTNTVIQQQATIWRPSARYVAPVVVNSLGQTFRDQATASNNLSRVILVPRRLLVQDAA